jgi:hypothetical protein
MRQKDDKSFAELLNRLREGNQTEGDVKELAGRVISPTAANYPHNSQHMFRTNKEVDSYNEEVFRKNTSSEKTVVYASQIVVDDVANSVKQHALHVLNSGQKYKKHSETGGLKAQLQLAVGLQYDCTMNLDVEDGLTNGATCVLKKIQYKDNITNPSILWVKFIDNKIGMQWRAKYRCEHTLHGSNTWTPLFAVARTFLVNRILVSRKQFPLTPAAARTIHKSQGYTLSQAVVHMGTNQLAHSHYTAFSRVTNLKDLFILYLNEKKICVYSSTKHEMNRLRSKTKINLCYTPVYDMCPEKTRVIFHNVRSLHKHFQDVASNINYLSADIICFAETRLIEVDMNDDYAMNGFHTVIRNDQHQSSNLRPPHGLAIYVKDTYTVHTFKHFSEGTIELSFVFLENVDRKQLQIIVLYKSKSCSLDHLMKTLGLIGAWIDTNIPHVFVGDFNIDITEDQNKMCTRSLENCLQCSQVVNEPTTVYGTTIDLAFTAVECVAGTIDSVISDHKILTLQF